MKHVASTVLILMLVGAAAPVASAQVPTDAPATVELRIKPFDAPVGADGANTRAEVSYCYHALGSIAFSSTEVRLKIAEQPPWMNVIVSPSTLQFEIQGGAPTGSIVCSAPQSVTLQALPFENVTDPQPGTIRVTATAKGNPPIAGASAEDAILVKASGDACHHEDAAAESTTEDADASEGTLTAQSATGTPLATPVSALVIGLGLAGASVGAGLALRRRRD